jgi:protein-S-isoprenylcysteine O-methyltransferase Ste14
VGPNDTRSETTVVELMAAREGAWPLIRWIHRRRPILTAAVVVAAPLIALATNAPPADLLAPSPTALFVLPWLLMLMGVGVRLWGAGNLRKNQEITDRGIYVMVRHPLYLGSLSLFLAYFLTVGDPLVGLSLFAVLVGAVYYPTMLAEEEYLTLKFPGAFARYRPPPRLLPDLRRLGEALRTDRFGVGAAYRNLGFRSAGAFLALPLFLRFLRWVQGDPV